MMLLQSHRQVVKVHVAMRTQKNESATYDQCAETFFDVNIERALCQLNEHIALIKHGQVFERRDARTEVAMSQWHLAKGMKNVTR